MYMIRAYIHTFKMCVISSIVSIQSIQLAYLCICMLMMYKPYAKNLQSVTQQGSNVYLFTMYA